MTSKERAALRGQANGLDALFQVGKGGVTDAVIAQTDDALRAKELIKIKVLTETSPDTAREAADKLAAATGADVVQVIGGVMVLYRYSEELHTEKTPEKKRPATKQQARKMGYKVRPVRKFRKGNDQ